MMGVEKICSGAKKICCPMNFSLVNCGCTNISTGGNLISFRIYRLIFDGNLDFIFLLFINFYERFYELSIRRISLYEKFSFKDFLVVLASGGIFRMIYRSLIVCVVSRIYENF